MTVFRGKMTEDFEYADDLARCVIIVDIPSPSLTDPRNILKQEFLN